MSFWLFQDRPKSLLIMLDNSGGTLGAESFAEPAAEGLKSAVLSLRGALRPPDSVRGGWRVSGGGWRVS